jgi:hypothetical protein
LVTHVLQIVRDDITKQTIKENKMKKITLTMLIILTFLISACASNAPIAEAGPKIEESSVQKPAAPDAAQQKPEQPVQTDSSGLTTDYENSVPITMQLLLGTIKLEGTDQSVTAEQAAALTPLWTNFKSVSESMKSQGGPGQGQGQGQGQQANATPQPADNEAQKQVDDIVKQIESSLTGDQIKAIVDMKITQEMAQTIMTEQGITMDGPQQGDGNAQGGGQPPSGGNGDMPQGTPPAGGPGGDGQQPSGDQQIGTPPAGGMQSGGGMGFIPSELIDALLKLLAEKTAS